MSDDKLLKVAKQAVLEAGKIVFKHFGQRNGTQNKNDDSSNLVTKADLESEKIIIKIISENFPEHNIIAEESEIQDKGSEYSWVIDPLDGTMSFVHNLPFFSVSVGLLKNNHPIVGALYHVVNKDLYWAQEGKGAYLNGKRVTVSKINRLDEAAVILGFGSRKRRLEKFEKYAKHLINKVAFPYAFSSGSTGHGFLSRGMVEATIDIGWVWDFAAGTVIIREAGGKVTGLDGGEPKWNELRLDLVTSNGLIHDELLEALQG